MKGKIYLLVVLLALCITGCGQGEKVTPRNSSTTEIVSISVDSSETGLGEESQENTEDGEKMPIETEIVFPETYKNELDYIVFDAEIVCPETVSGGQVALPEIEIQELDENKVVKQLFKNTEVNEREENNTLGEDGNYSQYITYIGAGMNLGYQKDRMDYMTDFSINVGHAFDLEDNPDQYSKDGQLDFLDLDTARQGVLDEIAAMGIDLGEGLIGGSYALDHETLQKEEEVLDMDGNPDRTEYRASWTQEDDCYYFYGWQTYAGIKVHYPYVEFINKMADFNAPIQAVYSKRGIEYLAIGKTFLFGQAVDSRALLPFEEIVQTITDKYSMLLTDTVATVKNMELCYYPQKKENGRYDLTCIWAVTFAETTEDGESRTFQMGIDAFTGEELY